MVMKIKNTFLGLMAFLATTMTSCSTFSLINSEVYNNANLADFHTFRIITPNEGKLPPGMEMVTYYNIAAAIREQMVDRGYTENPESPIVINIGLTVNNEYYTQPVSTLAPPPPMPPFGPNPGGPNPGDQAPGGLGIPGRPGGPGGPGVPPPPGPGSMNWFPYNGPGPAPMATPFFMFPRQYYWNGTQVVTGMYKEGVLTMDIVNIDTKQALFSASVATILENGDSQFRNLSGIAEAVKTLFQKYPVPLLPQYRNQKN